MTKKLIASILAAVGALGLQQSVQAQQLTRYTQFMFNRMAFNPAAAGYKEVVSATGLYRYQWAGFGEGAPRTLNLNVHTPLERFNSGIGLNIINDQIGFGTSTMVTFNYAYRLNVAGGKLSFGAAAGINQQSLDGTKLRPEQAGDPNIPQTNATETPLEISGGAYYQNDRFYLGASMMQINQAKSSGTNGVFYDLRQHVFVMGGATFAVAEAMKLQPNALVKSDLSSTQFDIGANLVFNNKFWGGLSYNSSADINLLLGAYPIGDNENNPRLGIGYAYGYATGALAGNQSGIHEIMVHYDFPVKVKRKPIVPLIDPLFL